MSTHTNYPQRRLGAEGPLVSAIGYGAMGISAFYGQVQNDEERFKVSHPPYTCLHAAWLSFVTRFLMQYTNLVALIGTRRMCTEIRKN